MQKKKSLVSQNIFARDERLLFIKSYAVPLLFYECYFIHLSDTSYIYTYTSDISSLDNGWVPSAPTFPDSIIQNLGQPLRGQFHLSSQLLYTDQQLSEFKYKCNNPLHSFFLITYDKITIICHPCQYLSEILSKSEKVAITGYLFLSYIPKMPFPVF